MRKSIKSIMAFALAATLAASTLAPATTAAAASKQNVITKATTNGGTTTKYSYNKKGLISKSVATYSSKGTDSDLSITTTTTYKYNKKNKIATKTEKTVNKETTYETDKTTKLKLGAKIGTVTTTTTSVTKFTYNKKGLATESVTTTTTGMSGDTKITEKKRSKYGTELADGTYLAGYNKYNADGTKNYENTKANAYNYTGTVSYNEIEETTTTKYTDNGNGSYKETKVETTPSVATSMKSEEVATYYHRKIAEDGTVTMVPLTKAADSDYKYTDAEGNAYNYYGYDDEDGVIAIKTGVTVAVNPEASGSSGTKTVTTDTTNEGKTVATTKYSYDKKKRVKKAVTTTVYTGKTLTTKTTVSTDAGKTYSSNNTEVNDSEYTYESTSVSTKTYTYDKKGRAKKVVYANDGKADSVETIASKNTSRDYTYTSTASDGTVTTNKNSSSQAAYDTVDKTVTKNGVTTYSTIHNPYTIISSYTDSEGKTSSNTDEYSYSATGCVKNVETNVYTSGNKQVETTYSPEAFSKTPAVGRINAYSRTYSSGSSENTDYYYFDGKTSAKEEERKSKFEAVAAAFVPATYEEVTSQEAALANPSKSTTTYAYDKSGNVKSAKKSGTRTKIDTLKNETYGNDIYEFDAYGKCREKKVATTVKYTDKDVMDNVVKKGTKSLTKKVTASTGESSGREKDPGTYLSRVLYSIKSKKGDSKAKKQQWIIQNGALNGEVGLN